MAYTSTSNRPNEYANKSNHSHIINDEEIKAFLGDCELPKGVDEIELDDLDSVIDLVDVEPNPIKYVITVDGGYTPVIVKKSFPSSQVAFFQFGAFLLNLDDWQNLDTKPFISPEQMATFNQLERYKLVLPIKFVNRKNAANLTDSVRKSLYEFFIKDRGGSCLMETLRWLIFEEYNPNSTINSYSVSNPIQGSSKSRIELVSAEMRSNYTFDIGGDEFYLTDVFRLHEKIDDELGAGGLLGHITNLVEQIIIAHCIRSITKIQPKLLEETLFIKDGSLAFFDVTARLHESFRNLINYWQQNKNLYLVGLEKSGGFVEHALEVSKVVEGASKLKSNHAILLSNDYIYNYIIPGDAGRTNYGETSYYSGKVIVKSKRGATYVTNIPIKQWTRTPTRADFPNLDVILHNICSLNCEMFDNALVPVTLVNKLVSLANHPSQILLEKFAKQQLNPK